MEKRHITRKTYNKVADLWKEYRDKPQDEIKDLVKDYKNKTVLDLGCGSGRYLSVLDKSNYIVEFDYSESMLQNNPHNIKVLGDITLFPFRKEVFDVVLGVAVLHHFDEENLLKVLGGIKEILKKDGKGIFTFWFRTEFLNKGAVNIPWKKDGVHYPRYYYFYSKEQIEAILKRSGFAMGKVYIDRIGKSIVMEVVK